MTRRKTTANIGLAIWRLKCFYETFVQGSTVVILLNFCAKIRHIAKPKNVSSNIIMMKLKTLLFKSHFILIALVVINFAFKNLLSISLNYQFVFILKVLIYISGFLLLFFHLKPLKKITIYFFFTCGHQL